MIQFSHLYKTYPGPVTALKNITINIDKGEFVFLTGPSGAGKTTLFKIISAYSKPSSGNIEVAGYDLNKIRDKEVPYFRRKIGVVYQDFKLLNDRNVFENVALPLEVRGERQSYINNRTNEILEQVGLYTKKGSSRSSFRGGSNREFLLPELLFIIRESWWQMSPQETWTLISAKRLWIY